MASVMVMFVGDWVSLRQKVRKYRLIPRTTLFLVFGLIVLPFLITLLAAILRATLLEPFQESMVIVLVVFFFLVGIFLELKN